MSASNAESSSIQISVWLWVRLLMALRRGGRRIGESGAFVLGRRETRKATTYVCYNVLDPNAYQGGAIAFHAAGYAALSAFCRDRKLEVLFDIHTHPGAGVGQSDVDQRHPMLPLVGHTALIVPYFGQTPWWSLRSIGVYEYLGNFQWRSHSPSRGGRRVKLTLW